jgi:hypothetical protein
LYDTIVVDLPKGMPIGTRISEQVRFVGYFFKVQAYQPALAKPRDPPLPAPMLIGRLVWKQIDLPNVEQTPSTQPVDQAKPTEVQKWFSAILEEAHRGAALLESHPGREAIQEEARVLTALLDSASAVCPANARMSAFAAESRTALLAYFDACLTIAKRPLYGMSPALAKKRLDFACDENARLIRNEIERMTAELIEPPPERAKASGPDSSR